MSKDELSLDELDKVEAGYNYSLENLERRLDELAREYNKISNPNDERKIELSVLIQKLNKDYKDLLIQKSTNENGNVKISSGRRHR